MRAVLVVDCNVIVSAPITKNKSSPPCVLLDELSRDGFELLLSPDLVDE